MKQPAYTFRSVIQRPSAFLPLVLALSGMLVVLVHVVTAGMAGEPDEGAAAHLWQCLTAAQLVLTMVFGATWLRRAPRQAGEVLLLQAGAALATLVPVYLLRL